MRDPREGVVADPALVAERTRLVSKSVKTWTGELIDLGGRNTLLFYRDLKQGTVDISPGSMANGVAVDELLGGHTTRLSNLFGDVTLAAAARRARTVKAKAKENFEERGLSPRFWRGAWRPGRIPVALPSQPLRCSCDEQPSRPAAVPVRTSTDAAWGVGAQSDSAALVED